MNLLFDKGSLMILESLSFTKSLYAFDFDGTLSKILRVPSEATVSRTTTLLLRELSKLVPVAIVSGRSIEDLRQRLPFEPAFVVGNHGLEGLGYSRNALKGADEACRKWSKALQRVDFGAGVELEDKTYSLALHFRRSRNKKAAREKILQAVGRLSPSPRVMAGKSVINLIPEGAPHKGAAVMELMKKAGALHAFYIGDDDTDEDVFSLTDDRSVMTVRVGEKKTSHARYYIERQSEINRLLRCLIRFQKSGSGS